MNDTISNQVDELESPTPAWLRASTNLKEVMLQRDIHKEPNACPHMALETFLFIW